MMPLYLCKLSNAMWYRNIITNSKSHLTVSQLLDVEHCVCFYPFEWLSYPMVPSQGSKVVALSVHFASELQIISRAIKLMMGDSIEWFSIACNIHRILVKTWEKRYFESSLCSVSLFSRFVFFFSLSPHLFLFPLILFFISPAISI